MALTAFGIAVTRRMLLTTSAAVAVAVLLGCREMLLATGALRMWQ